MEQRSGIGAAAHVPRSVSRGSKLQIGYLGLDSLYLILEYPHADVFNRWSAIAGDITSPRLQRGIPYEDVVIRSGKLGYKLAIWNGDARLFITDYVDGNLGNTETEGQGMGAMPQLGPKWLCRFGDLLLYCDLHDAVYAQLEAFGIHNASKYKARLNRVDIAVDVLGLDVGTFAVDEWREGWVGYATSKTFYDSTQPGRLEGLSIGSSSGAVRFKVYDKVLESILDGDSDFWRSVWSSAGYDLQPVARFEWSIKCYQARFGGIRYLPDLTYESLLSLLNYVSQDWGSLRIPQADDTNKTRWETHPLWLELQGLIDDWSLGFQGTVKRDYDFSPDIKDAYLRSLAGWLAGLLARLGVELDRDGPVSVGEALRYLDEQGYSLPDILLKAQEKWELYSRLSGKDMDNASE